MQKFYAEYIYSEHIHEILISFEHTVSSDRSLITLLNYYIIRVFGHLKQPTK